MKNYQIPFRKDSEKVQPKGEDVTNMNAGMRRQAKKRAKRNGLEVQDRR